MAQDLINEVGVYPVNSNGEILLQSGTGNNSVAGYINSTQVPTDISTNKMVVKLPVDVPQVVVDTNNNPQTLAVSSSAPPVPLQQLGARRYEALYKPMGSSANGVSFGQSASLSTAKFTATVKAELEADIDAVRILYQNRAITALTNVTALVGVTETADVSTSAKLGSPTILGTTYQALQGATDANGWRSVTWGGATSTSVPASTSAIQIAISDWIPKSTIARADGGTRPLLLWRTFVDGTVTSPAFMSNYSVSLQQPTAPMRNRIIQNSANTAADAVSAPATAMGSGFLSLESFPICRFRVPVFSVWGVGDSITQNDGLVVDKISSWGMRACMDLSTPSKPVVYANMGCSSQTSATYISICRTFLATGVPAPSCLVVSPASVNDAGYDANFAEKQSSQIIELLKLCSDYKIPYIVMWPWLPNNGYNLAQDNARKAMNVKMKAAAQAAGVIWIEFPTLGDGASPERYTPSYRFDNVHPNELAIETVMTPALKAALAPLV